MSDLYFNQMQLGPMGNYTYLVGSLSAGKCYAIDFAWDVNTLNSVLSDDNMKLAGVLLTHCHPDHCGGDLYGQHVPGVAELMVEQDLSIRVHESEKEFFAKVTGISDSAVSGVQDGEKISLGDVAIEALHTPGHSPGGMCFIVEDKLISGDTLFISACGRVDLPGGDPDKLFNSLNVTLKGLSDDFTVYPGHNYDGDPYARLGDVKQANPYMKVSTLQQWRQMFGY